MKRLFLLLFYLACWFTGVQALEPGAPAPLYRHLVEINHEWLHQAPTGDLLKTVAFADDQARISTHLQLVEQTLRQREGSALNPVQRANRARHLDALREYWQTNLFPTNHYHNLRRPYFRDNYSVLCAVGYLLWQDDQRQLVNRINKENNYGYIAELAVQYPEIGIWAQKNGFSQDELAWIQPAYEPKPLNISNWGNGGGLNPGGRINVMEKDAAETRLFVAGHFSAIDGFTANNIVEWDGSNWKVLGNGVVGEVFALEYYKNGTNEKLYVAGDFHLPGDTTPCNIAEYNIANKSWKSLQSGDMMGKVYALCSTNFGTARLSVGGDFKKINGLPANNLATYYHNYQDWNHYSPDTGLGTDGPVYSIISISPNILIGGAFQQVYQLKDSAWVDAPHLAYYGYFGNWTPLQHALSPVRSLAYFNGSIYTGHELYFDSLQDAFIGTNMLKAGLWFSQSYFPAGDNSIHGFVDLGERLLIYGGFLKFDFTYGWGAAVFEKDYTDCKAYLLADSTITAMQTFRGHIYVAGDFQTLFFEPTFPGMARIQLPTVAIAEADETIPVQVTASPNHLRLRYEMLEQPTRLNIFDLQGRLLHQEDLNAGMGELKLPADVVWADGLYVWQLQNNAGRRTGKWVISR